MIVVVTMASMLCIVFCVVLGRQDGDQVRSDGDSGNNVSVPYNIGGEKDLLLFLFHVVWPTGL